VSLSIELVPLQENIGVQIRSVSINQRSVIWLMIVETKVMKLDVTLHFTVIRMTMEDALHAAQI
jgi:hypothetical protein